MKASADPTLTMDTAIPGLHPDEGGLSAPDLAEKCDFDGAAEVLGPGVGRRREHCRHGVVHPDLDRPELLLDLVSRGVDLFELSDVHRDNQGPAPFLGDLSGRSCESIGTAGKERHVKTPRREC